MKATLALSLQLFPQVRVSLPPAIQFWVMAVLHNKLDRFKFFKFGGVMWDDAQTTKIVVLADSSDRTISLEVQWKVSPGHDGQREMCTYLNDLKKLISKVPQS